LLICDVDHFKTVNDRHGHRAGDLLLIEIAHLLEQHGDVGRLGGDEFAVWVDGGEAEAAAAAAAMLDDIRDKLPTRVPDASAVGLSVGGAVAPRDGTDVTRLLEAADAALYAAKDAGRSRAQLHPV
jgi:diguanylate cyclase (GGDEF)-like protein